MKPRDHEEVSWDCDGPVIRAARPFEAKNQAGAVIHIVLADNPTHDALCQWYEEDFPVVHIQVDIAEAVDGFIEGNSSHKDGTVGKQPYQKMLAWADILEDQARKLRSVPTSDDPD